MASKGPQSRPPAFTFESTFRPLLGSRPRTQRTNTMPSSPSVNREANTTTAKRTRSKTTFMNFTKLQQPSTPTSKNNKPSTKANSNTSSTTTSSTTASPTTTSQEDMSPQPPIHIKEFRSSEEPYQILPGRTLGTGRWSNVLLATPSQSSSSIVPHHDDGFLTPPASPTTPKTVGQLASEKRPEFYAIKTAANRACIAALRHEATILTYLSTKRDHHMHIVTFHGYDESQNGLVFTAMPTSLETVITNNLASQNESNRTSTLATILPPMIKSLVSSLAWLHNTGIVHGDIKPGNILLKSTGPFDQNADILKGPFQQLLADFTSSFGLVDTIMYDPSTYAVHGGGTYEYLAPELLSKPYPPPAKPADVYAMAITILTVIIGASPFSCAAGNRFRLLDMIKAGQPLEYAQRDHLSADRIFDVAMAVKRSSGMDVLRMLKKALRKDPAERLSAKDWYGEF